MREDNGAVSRLDVRSMALLAIAHVTDDVNQSFIPALLPYLIVWRGLSHTDAGTLVLAQAISSSVLQPAIGYVADRRSMPWLIAVGLMLAGGGVAIVGFMPTLPLMWLGALISGIGVASFHPEAARFANYVAGAKKATGMRWFAAGGNVGFAVGPIFATAVIAAWGLPGTLAACVPVTVDRRHRAARAAAIAHVHSGSRDLAHRARAPTTGSSFGKLSAFVTVRAMAYFGFVAFVPLYVVEVLHGSPAVGDALLTAFCIAGVAAARCRAA